MYSLIPSLFPIMLSKSSWPGLMRVVFRFRTVGLNETFWGIMQGPYYLHARCPAAKTSSGTRGRLLGWLRTFNLSWPPLGSMAFSNKWLFVSLSCSQPSRVRDVKFEFAQNTTSSIPKTPHDEFFIPPCLQSRSSMQCLYSYGNKMLHSLILDSASLSLSAHIRGPRPPPAKNVLSNCVCSRRWFYWLHHK